MCDGLGQNKIGRVCKNSGPVLSRLWTKVHEILGQCRRPFILFNALARLSVSHFVQQIFAIKYPRCIKTWQMFKILVPIFLERRPQFFYGWLLVCDLPSIVRQSVFEFHLPISVCKAWQWNRVQNLQRVGKNVWSRLWTKIHVVLRWHRRPLVVVNTLARLSISCFVLKI